MEAFIDFDWCSVVVGLLLILGLGILFDRIWKFAIEPMLGFKSNVWKKLSFLWSNDYFGAADRLLQVNLNNSQTVKIADTTVVIGQDDCVGKKHPVNEFKKDKQISHELNEFRRSNAETSDQAKELNKKLMQDGVDQRIALLNTIKSLCKRTKRVERLEKELHNVSEKKDNVPTEQQATRVGNSLIPNNAPSEASEKTKKKFLLRQSTTKSQSDEDIGKPNVEKCVSITDPLHLSTISEIPSDTYSGRSTIEKLERITNSIDEIHEKVQSDIEQLAHKLLGMFNEWEEAKITRQRHRQLSEDLNCIESMLLAGVEKVRNLQCMVGDDSSIEKAKIDVGDSLIDRQQITYLEEDLKNLKQENSNLLQEKARLDLKLVEAELRERKLARDYKKLLLVSDERQRQQQERIVSASAVASTSSPRNNNRLSSNLHLNNQQQQQQQQQYQPRRLDDWVLGHAQGEAARQQQMRRFESDTSRSARAYNRMHLHVRSFGNSSDASLSNSAGKPRTPRQRRSIRSRLSANPY